jgi:hypothetical protein
VKLEKSLSRNWRQKSFPFSFIHPTLKDWNLKCGPSSRGNFLHYKICIAASQALGISADEGAFFLCSKKNGTPECKYGGECEETFYQGPSRS